MGTIVNVGSLMLGIAMGGSLVAILIEIWMERDKGPAEEDTKDWRTPCDLCRHGPAKNRMPCITCPAERDWGRR